VGETIHPSTGGANALGTQHIAALAAGGVGIAGVVVGTVFGLQAISKNADADTRCNGLSCSDPQGVADASDAHKAGTISTVAFAVGAAGLAAGAVLWFTAKPAGTAARLGVGVGSVQVEGVW
jgi:hypothetical protein